MGDTNIQIISSAEAKEWKRRHDFFYELLTSGKAPFLFSVAPENHSDEKDIWLSKQ